MVLVSCKHSSYTRQWVLKGSQIWKCMSKILGVYSPLQSRGPQTIFLPRFRNLTATLTAYIFGMKHDIHKRASVLQTTRGLLHRLKTIWTLVHKRLQIGRKFLPTLQNSAFHASQTEISKRNSTKFCQTVDSRSRYQSVIVKLRPSLPKNWDQETIAFVRFFDDLET